MPRIDVLISVIRILSIFFYTAILQGLTIQQYKNRKILKYKYKTRLKLWRDLIRLSERPVHVENT